MGARSQRFWLVALVVGVLGVAAFWLWPRGQAIVALNRAGLASAWAVKGTAGWPQAEEAWLAASRIGAARPAARRGLAQAFWFWYSADAPAARAAAQALVDGPPAAPELSDALAAAGDVFRGHGSLETAAVFYRGALSRADFSSPAAASQAQRYLSLAEQPIGSNLALNSNFNDGLAGWRAWGQPPPAAGGGQAELNCGDCGLAQDLPLLGAGVYELSFDARAGVAGAAMQAEFSLPDDAPWKPVRRWAVAGGWQRLSALVWMPYYNNPAWTLSLRPAGAGAMLVRNVVVQKVDGPGNRLFNPSFDYFDPAMSPEYQFPPWRTADFWNAARAQGGWRATTGPDGSTALEIELTGAAGPPERVGLQQGCGSAPAGAAITLQADLNLPAGLAASVARVQAILYQSAEAGHWSTLVIQQQNKTAGWEKFSATGRVPELAGDYRCVLLVELDARGPLAAAAEIARFDGIVITVGP